MQTMAERIVIPGGTLDPHVHFRQPGATHKEDFTTGTRAALKGGYTAVFDMPNNPIPTVTPDALDEKRRLAHGNIYVDVGFNYGGTLESSQTFQLVIDRVRALKVYMNPTTGNLLVKTDQELETIFTRWPRKYPIMVHAEGSTFERAINMARKTGQRLHLCHMSLASEMQMVIDAKNEGLPVTCEVSAHHLFLAEQDAPHLPKGQGMMKPPLATEGDRQALWDNIDAIDILASDHAPYTLEEKSRFTPDAGPYGVTGLETTLPLMLTAVNAGWLSMEKLVDIISTKPREIFGLKSDNQTYTEVILGDRPYVIDAKNLETRARQTPFDGHTVDGRVANVELRGSRVLQEGEIIDRPQGKAI